MYSVVKQINENIQYAHTLDSNNIRVNFVVGEFDFRTPKTFGGGLKAEKYLIKAIEYPEHQNELYASWGKQEAYTTLVQFYIENDEKELALKYLAKAKRLYPKNYWVLKLEKSVNTPNI